MSPTTPPVAVVESKTTEAAYPQGAPAGNYPPAYAAQGQPQFPPGPQYPPQAQYPPGQYPQGQGQQAAVYPPQVQMQRTIWTKQSQPAICQYCHQQTQTLIHKENGTGAWIVAGILCCLTPCCCIAWMPFCDNGCSDVKHQCQHCNMLIGEKRFLDI